MITAGTYKARATKALLSQVGANKTPAIQVVFQIQDEGPHQGETIRWDGWLTSNAERTMEALDYCGWTGDDISVFAKEGAPLQGLDLNDVELVIIMEPWQTDATKFSPKVNWVNRIGGRGLNVENAMPQAEALAFAEKMKGIVLKTRAKGGATISTSSSSPNGSASMPSAEPRK